MSGRRLARLFWVGAGAILVAAALVALAAVLEGELSDTDARILATLAAVLYSGATGLAGLALADRGTARALGRAVAAASPLALALEAWGIWSLVVDGGSETPSKAAWSGVLALAAGLIATTCLLLARRPALVPLAAAAGVLAGVAALTSVVGIWAEPGGDAYVKLVAALWILAALAYLLVPVLHRFTAAGEPAGERVLASLGDVELLASRRPAEGIVVEGRLRQGERLVLRRVRPRA